LGRPFRIFALRKRKDTGTIKYFEYLCFFLKISSSFRPKVSDIFDLHSFFSNKSSRKYWITSCTKIHTTLTNSRGRIGFMPGQVVGEYVNNNQHPSADAILSIQN